MEGDLTAVGALTSVCRTLGIAPTQLAAAENVGALNHTFPIAALRAAGLTLPAISAFRAAFGEAGRLEIKLGDLTELSTADQLTEESLADFTHRARTTGGQYDVTLLIQKSALAERLGLAQDGQQRVYLFGEALVRALRRGISWFEDEVWQDPAQPLRIVVLDTDVALTGPMLALVGGSHLAAGAPTTPNAELLPNEAASEGREQHVGWEHRWVRALTPWNFALTGTCSDPVLEGLLHAQLIKLAILFTGDRARMLEQEGAPGLIRAEYRGREHVAIVPLDETQPSQASAPELAAVLRAVSWCYRAADAGEPHWLSDRLPFLQTRLAQVLEPHAEAGRVDAFARAMPFVLEGVKWQWKAFVEGKVSTYLEQVQQVETAVTETVATVGDRTAAVVKTLTDSLLAAVAVLIGTFIAAVYKDPFDATLFRIGMRAYAGYVLLFPGLIGLLAARQTMALTVDNFQARVMRFKEVIYPEKVDEVIGRRVTAARRGFLIWLIVAAVVYAALGVGTWVATDQIPRHVHQVKEAPKRALGLNDGRALL
jgi:hypothetical protein